MTFCLFYFLLSKIPFDNRGDIVSESQKIVIAIVDSYDRKSYFYEGTQLAVQELNSAGGVLGKQIEILYYDDKNDVKTGEKISKLIAKNKEVVAVIGHRNSEIAINASITYKEAGIIFLSPVADLNRYKGDFIFRHAISDETLCKSIADFALRHKYQKLTLLYDLSTETKNLLNFLKKLLKTQI
ncbi:MAG: hypothetical protein OMM_08350 [Candidatus Magnetoglobus multicellularis str. Araruama]|uniref:Leucine-binding protein domain-containing protein n=1 Tax=Candidatus Magnetoglobus multicellularis str. Araruama TaxID=890399 RepID=A0A1V1P8J1_9BACT|nr:MAG: hypothetical protein OMM_08350 [Candidatus Magnetoglobus multicellularis str. Araruama]